MEKYKIVIIGAGQAGLAMGYFLQQTKVSFVLLEAQSRIGESWRNRYDSLILFTPKRYSSLPGLLFPGDPSSYPTKDETGDYLESYANHFSLPIHLNTSVHALTKVNDQFIISTTNKTYLADKVVVATGPFQKPMIPQFSSQLSTDIFQIHSSQYQNPAQLREGNVLVVGGGNSGAQIATELAKHKKTYLAVSRPVTFIPLNFLGKSIFWYFDRLGLLQADVSTKRGMWLRQQSEKIYGFALKRLLKNKEVIQKPRVAAAKSRSQVVFADQTELTVQNVIWATGFQMDFSWIRIQETLHQQQQPIHQNGISPIHNLFFLGLPWLSCRGSALLGWVGQDAERLLPNLLHDLSVSSDKGKEANHGRTSTDH